jgi:hypothetical protein
VFGKGKERTGRPPETGSEAEVENEIAGDGGEGARNAEATPKLSSAAHPGQTSHPAPPDDVGVPSDEEIGREEREAE